MTSWIPNLYLREGARREYDPKYLDQLVKDGKALLSAHVPVIFSLAHLARITGVSFGQLYEVVSRKMDPYRAFNIRKKSGGYRRIAVPEPFLMLVQRWINKNILTQTKVHDCSKAYRAQCSPIKNAQAHCGAKWLIKLDIVSFFESIDERQVYSVFRGLGYRPLVAFELTRLTTRDAESSSNKHGKRWTNPRPGEGINTYAHRRVGNLPQGAPTSPLLANSVCYPMDIQFFDLSQEFGATYTRYADDIVLSGYSDFRREVVVRLLKESSRILRRYGFDRNDHKTHIVSPGTRKIVTGLLVHHSTPRLSREFRERIEMHLYFANKFGVAEHCRRRNFFSIIGFHDHLKGLIAWARQVDPDLAERYERDFSSLSWPMA